jgi:hypothetical protein
MRPPGKEARITQGSIFVRRAGRECEQRKRRSRHRIRALHHRQLRVVIDDEARLERGRSAEQPCANYERSE